MKKIPRNTSWVFWMAGVMLMMACSDDNTQSSYMASLDPLRPIHRLRGFDGNEDFLTYAKEAARQNMRAAVEIDKRNALERTQWYGETSTDGSVNLADDMMTGAEPAAGADEGISMDRGDANGDVGETDYSTTNTQEADVDEADLVKTDGEYIYALTSGVLVIVEAGLEGQMTRSGSLDVGGYAQEMFINDDTGLIFSIVDGDEVPEEMRYKSRPQLQSDYGIYEDDFRMDQDIDAAPEPGVSGTSDMPVCGSHGCYNGSYARMTMVDLSDKTAPEVIRSWTYTGTYITSRMVGSQVTAVIDSPMAPLEFVLDYGQSVDWSDESDIEAAYQHVIDSNTEYFDGVQLGDIMPRKYDSAAGRVAYIVDPTEITAPETPEGLGLQTIVSLDLGDETANALQVAVFAQTGVVYASSESLYLTSNRDYVTLAMESGLWGGQSNATTGIHKFGIQRRAKTVEYLASGEIQGRLLNQFSMGEYQGYLRLAATTGNGWWSENTLENHVYVLGQNGTRLDMVGSVSGLGEGEEIYSARFMGDRGFVVTFFETDPLYTLDMSDPENPTVIGEWKGPGYSTYLHPWGPDLIISIGMEEWQPVISLFDISDYADPTLVARHFLEGENTVAVGEHRAFTFNPDTGWLTLPFSGWSDSYFQTGVNTYTLSEDAITEGDAMNFFTSETGPEYQESSAIRSLYIADYMYGVSRCRLVSAPLSAPSATVQALPLFAGDHCGESGYYW